MGAGTAPLAESASKEEALKELGEWASRYEMIAAMGYLAALLMVGKAVNNLGKAVKFRFTPPSAVISGCLGLALYDITGACSQLLQVELEATLRSIEVNIVNFVFTSLVLGFTSGTKKTKMTFKRIFGLIWHEGMPMLLYAQALIWGNSCFALAITGIYRLWNKEISTFEGGLVTLGLEAGRDVLPSRVKFKEESLAAVHLADSVGLAVSIAVGVLLVAFRRVSPNRRQEWFGVGRGQLLTTKEGPLTSREHFQRGGGFGVEMPALGPPRLPSPHPPAHAHGSGLGGGRQYYSAGSLRDMAQATEAAQREEQAVLQQEEGEEEEEEERAVEITEEGVACSSPSEVAGLGARGVTQRAGSIGGGGGGGQQRKGKGCKKAAPTLATATRTAGGVHYTPPASQTGGEDAALGSHIALIALSVFLGYLLNLSLKYLELNREFLRNHHLISGIRLFKICMVAAVVCMTTVRSLSNLRFKSDWFHRLAGFFLDLMAVAAISSMRFDHYKKVANLELVVMVVLGCVLWNLLAFFAFAKPMFPNFWYARGVTLMGDALGHSWVGLLLARAIDPQLQTPVPMAFTYKLLVFFVPGSGAKNGIVISLIDAIGLWPTFLVCLLSLYLWMKVFDSYYKRRWPRQPGGGGGGRQRNKAGRYGEERRRTGTDDSEMELLNVGGGSSGAGGLVGEEGGDVLRGALEEGKPHRTMPTLSEPSVVLTKQHMRKLLTALPERDAIRNWRKVYCMGRDGASLGTLMYKVMSQQQASSFLIVIEDSWGYVFGGYVPVPFQNASGYYGTGECFVFKFHPEFTVYPWTGKNDYFVLTNAQHLAMGGGGSFAFQLDDELDTGVSGPSDTFGNTRLSSRHIFKCLSIEIWGFEMGGTEVAM